MLEKEQCSACGESLADERGKMGFNVIMQRGTASSFSEVSSLLVNRIKRSRGTETDEKML